MADVRFFKLLLSSLLLLGAIHVNASDYRYNLYLGLGPIKIPAGTAHLYDSEVIYEGMLAVRTAMVETAHYSKDNDRFIVNLDTWDMNTNTRTNHSTEWRPTRIFDIMSMIAFAQNIDTSNRELGSTENLPMVNGNKVVQQYLVYIGNKKIKADDGCTYDCMVISIRDYSKGKERETVKAYVTNDSKHTPVQLDIILSTGTSIKALLK